MELSTCFLRQNFCLADGSPVQLGQQAPGILSLPPQLWDYKCVLPCPVFYQCSGNKRGPLACAANRLPVEFWSQLLAFWRVGRVTWELISRDFGLGLQEGGVCESPFPPGWHIHVYIRNEDRVHLAS